MNKRKMMSGLIVVLTLISGLTGIFYTFDGEPFMVQNIYGTDVEMFGDGIYAFNSVFKATIMKGTDVVMIIVAALFGVFSFLGERSNKFRFLQIGALSGLLYYSSSMVFGVTFNRLFPVYVMLFSSSLFMLISLISDWMKEDNIRDTVKEDRLIGTAVFLLICGSSVLVWLEFIIPALISGTLATEEIHLTEPTFVFDLGIILPAYIGSGIALLRKKTIGYKLTPILLTFIIIIGWTVIGQNIFQSFMGITVPTRELFTLVISFALLGLIATFINIRFSKYIK